jgi:hypothetical protein
MATRDALKALTELITPVGERTALSQLLKYSPDQPRDERGRFGSGGDTAPSSPKIEAQPKWKSPPEFRSMADAEHWLGDKGIKLNTGEMERLGITPQQLHVVTDQMLRMDAKFPGIMDEMKSIRAYPEVLVNQNPGIQAGIRDMRMDTFSLEAQTRQSFDRANGSELLIGPGLIKAMQNPEEYKASVEANNAGWKGMGYDRACISQDVSGIFSHEMGHVIQNAQIKEMEDAGQMVSGTARAGSRWSREISGIPLGGGASIFEQAASKAGYLDGGEPNQNLAKDVSIYATTSPRETHSEILALVQDRGLVNSLPADAKQRIATYQQTLNDLAGKSLVKARVDKQAPISLPSEDSPTSGKYGIIGDDFGLGPEFWAGFDRRVADKNKKTKP